MLNRMASLDRICERKGAVFLYFMLEGTCTLDNNDKILNTDGILQLPFRMYYDVDNR